MANNITYRSVIAQAIADFNDIQSAIAGHNIKIDANTVLQPASSSNGSLVATNTLAGLITNKLQRLSVGYVNLAAADITFDTTDNVFKTTSAASLEAIKYATGVTIPKATFGHDTTNDNIIKVTTAGYIAAGTEVGTVIEIDTSKITLSVDDNTTTKLTATKVGNSYQISGSLQADLTVNRGDYGYFKGANDLVDSSAIFGILDQGTLTVNYAANKESFTIVPTNSATATSTMNASAMTTVLDAAPGDDYEKITLTLKAEGNDKASVTAGVGYYGEAVTNSDIAIDIDEGTTTKYIGIKKATWGSLSNVKSKGIDLATTVTAGKGYLVRATGIDATSTAAQAGYTTGTGELSTGSGVNVDIGYIAAGSVSAQASLTSANIRVGSSSVDLVSTLPSGAVLGKDYFSVTTDIVVANSFTFTPGYIYTTGAANGFTANDSGTKYIGAAEFEFVQDDNTKDDDGNPLTFIQCKKSGYIETGSLRIIGKDGNIITDFANINSTNAAAIDWAKVKTNLTSSDGTNSTIQSGSAVPNGAYEITISKGSVDPGYISATEGQGSVALSSKYWINKTTAGSAITSVTSTVGFTSASSINVDTTKSSKFTITSTPTANAYAIGVVSESGYVRAGDDDVTTSKSENVVGTADTIYIKEATFKKVRETSDVVVKTSSADATMNGTAKVYANNSLSTGYVTVSAEGYNQVQVDVAGHTNATGTLVSNSKDSGSARIAATNGADATRSNSMTNAVIAATASFTPTTYGDSGTATSKTAGTYQFKVSGGSVTDAAVKDTYMVGNYTTKVADVSQNVTLPADATGAEVDNYVDALWSRMLGYSYADVDPDSAT